MADLIGHSLGRYQILEQLGEGGMATVYKAFDTQLEIDVAVKVIRRDAFPAQYHDRIFKRFDREARALAKLNHPNIVRVIEYGQHENSPFLVMEYVPAGTLKEKLGKPIFWQEAFDMLIPIAKALAYSHQYSIIHRDVKPSNILIAKTGELKLTDFGIAKVLENDEGQTFSTGTGVGVGTPEYMSPEQGMGKDVDARADVYSLGIVLYEALTAHKPFRADTPMAIIIKHINEPLPRPKKFANDLPDSVERILFKALAKNPKDRYQDMDEFAKAMEQEVLAYKKQIAKATQRKNRSKNYVNLFKSLTSSLDGKLPSPKSMRLSPRQIRIAGILTCVILISLGIGWIMRQSYASPISPITKPPTNTRAPTLSPAPTFSPSLTPTQIATSVPRATKTPDPVVQSMDAALNYVKSQKPAYSFVFDQPGAWDFFLPENVKTSNGELVVIAGLRNNPEYPADHWNAASIRLFTSHAFAVSFDFRIEGTGGQYTDCGFEIVDFKPNGEIAMRNMYVFVPRNLAQIKRTTDNQNFLTVARVATANDFTQYTSATIILLDANSAVFINDKLELLYTEQKDIADFEQFSFSANGTRDGLTCYFDNFQTWDLSSFNNSP